MPQSISLLRDLSQILKQLLNFELQRSIGIHLRNDFGHVAALYYVPTYISKMPRKREFTKICARRCQLFEMLVNQQCCF